MSDNDDELVMDPKVDRTGWGPGPWDDEPDKVNWKTKAGLPGMIVRSDVQGVLCGYVAVTKEHPLFGVSYGDGEQPKSPEDVLSVHGGLTYSNSCRGAICHVPDPGEPDDVWWFGFDCGHSFDYSPRFASFMKEKYGEGLFGGERIEYRDVAYVREEVESLASQLAALANGPDRRRPCPVQT
jgi:hypothetical protein